MRFLVLYIFCIFLLPLPLIAAEESTPQAVVSEDKKSTEVDSSPADAELIAELELLELFDLLENLNALASMEDTQ